MAAICAVGLSQTTPNVKQDAKDSACANILALAGNVSINCSTLTTSQRKIIDSIPAVLNKILANQLDPEAVMKKLDEILHALNPNLPVKVYFCNGTWRTAGPSARAALDINMGGDDIAFKEMIDLANSDKQESLLKVCLANMESKPEWLTPLLFCSLAYAQSGQIEKAKDLLARFDSRTGPAYETDACKQVSDLLHSRLP